MLSLFVQIIKFHSSIFISDYIGFVNDKRDFFIKLFRWDCWHECSYGCMWKTVEAFQKRGLTVPQFYGKVSEVILYLKRNVSLRFCFLVAIC